MKQINSVFSTKNTIKQSAIVAFAAIIMFAVTACGGGGKHLDGTYVTVNPDKKEASFSFSGNQVKVDFAGEKGGGTYVLVEDYADEDYSRGYITITMKDGGKQDVQEVAYTLKGNKLTLTLGGTDVVFTKK